MEGTAIWQQRIERLVRGDGDSKARAKELARVLGEERAFASVRIFRVEREKRLIELLAASPNAQSTHPSFGFDRGLNGVAVSQKSAVVCNDTTSDPRYLASSSETRSQMIVPIKDGAGGEVVGTIDVESRVRNAFGDADRAFLESCAQLLAPLFLERRGPAAAPAVKGRPKALPKPEAKSTVKRLPKRRPAAAARKRA